MGGYQEESFQRKILSFKKVTKIHRMKNHWMKIHWLPIHPMKSHHINIHQKKNYLMTTYLIEIHRHIFKRNDSLQ